MDDAIKSAVTAYGYAAWEEGFRSTPGSMGSSPEEDRLRIKKEEKKSELLAIIQALGKKARSGNSDAPGLYLDSGEFVPAAELMAKTLTASQLTDGAVVALHALIQSNPVRISQDPADPDAFIRTNADGSVEHGRLNERGDFVVAPAPTSDNSAQWVNIEAAAMALAEAMDYPWEEMPTQGREAMRKHAQAVIDAASGKKKGGA